MACVMLTQAVVDTGLARSYLPAQRLLFDRGLVPILHQIEGVSSANKVGPLAESLLEAVTVDNDELKAAVLVGLSF